MQDICTMTYIAACWNNDVKCVIIGRFWVCLTLFLPWLNLAVQIFKYYYSSSRLCCHTTLLVYEVINGKRANYKHIPDDSIKVLLQSQLFLCILSECVDVTPNALRGLRKKRVNMKNVKRLNIISKRKIKFKHP